MLAEAVLVLPPSVVASVIRQLLIATIQARHGLAIGNPHAVIRSARPVAPSGTSNPMAPRGGRAPPLVADLLTYGATIGR